MACILDDLQNYRIILEDGIFNYVEEYLYAYKMQDEVLSDAYHKALGKAERRQGERGRGRERTQAGGANIYKAQ